MKHLAIQEKKPNVITQGMRLSSGLGHLYFESENKFKEDSVSIDVSYDKLTELAIQKKMKKLKT